MREVLVRLPCLAYSRKARTGDLLPAPMAPCHEAGVNNDSLFNPSNPSKTTSYRQRDDIGARKLLGIAAGRMMSDAFDWVSRVWISCATGFQAIAQCLMARRDGSST